MLKSPISFSEPKGALPAQNFQIPEIRDKSCRDSERSGLVEYRIANIFKIIGSGISKYKKLEQGRADHDKTAFGVF